MTAREANRVYAERTQTEIHVQIEETLVDMVQLGSNAVSNGI